MRILAAVRIKLQTRQFDPTLHEQEAYFVYTDLYLAWVNYEGRAKTGKIGRGLPNKPSAIPRPPLRL